MWCPRDTEKAGTALLCMQTRRAYAVSHQITCTSQRDKEAKAPKNR